MKHGGRPHVEEGWAEAEGREPPPRGSDLKVTNEVDDAGSSAVPAVAGSDLDDLLDPLSQGLQPVQGRTQNRQPARARGPERLFVTVKRSNGFSIYSRNENLIART